RSARARLDRLGAFSPLARLRVDSPGARALLGEVERSAERALHVARGLFIAILLVVFLLQIGKTTLLLMFVAPAFAGAGLFWLLVWRALGRQQPPRGLPYALILVDAWLALRGPLAVWTPV